MSENNIYEYGPYPETNTPNAGRDDPGAPYTPPKQKSGVGKYIALALCCSILGGILGAGGMYLGGRLLDDDAEAEAMEQRLEELEEQLAEEEKQETEHSSVLQGQRDEVVLDISQIQTGKAMTPAEVYAANVNSTVGITTSVTTNYWGYTSQSAASGSGFIISEDGYILTNHHVIDGASTITVTLYDGTAYEAELVGYDESNDIAVLKVEAEGLSPVVLGDSDNVNVGDTVLAIGNPLGELTFSLTAGLVSALDREVTFSTGVTMDLIQTDCAINSGNSGGALFNLYGEVIGITNAKYSGSGSSSQASIDNIGFAIPMNSVRNIIKSIIEKGYIAKPYIGVSISDVGEEAQRYGLPKGAAIQGVEKGSPAEQAGLQVNDIVVKADDTAITGSSDLVDVVGAMETGRTVVLTVYRQGETMEISVTIGEQIQSAKEEPQQNQQSQQSPYPGYGWGY